VLKRWVHEQVMRARALVCVAAAAGDGCRDKTMMMMVVVVVGSMRDRPTDRPTKRRGASEAMRRGGAQVRIYLAQIPSSGRAAYRPPNERTCHSCPGQR